LCRSQKVCPHHVIAAQYRGQTKPLRACNRKLNFVVLNESSHEQVERLLEFQHEQVVVQLDPALIVVFRQA